MRRLRLQLSVVALAIVGCASQPADDGGSDDDDDDGSSAVGGAGGSGGVGGGGGSTGGCAADCSTITTPECSQPQCNEATGQCEIVDSPAGTPCDDELFCTVNDGCQAGLCAGGGQNDCGMDVAQCVTVTCNETTKSCSNAPAGDGAACVIDDLCIVNAACKNGLCTGAPKDCFFAPGGDCNAVMCNPTTGNCDATPDPTKNGAPCSSNVEPCLVSKTCDNGACVGGVPKDCTALDDNCNLGACEQSSGQCIAEPIPPGGSCTDAADECNTGVCDMTGNCQPVPTPDVACASQTNECNDGFCDAVGQCQPTAKPGIACPSATDQCNNGFCSATGQCEPTAANEGAVCNDGNSCTSGESCQAGACTGGVVGDYVVYFTETFAGNSAGWLLDTEWGIGPAMASSGQSYGNPDPAMDHTASADNGVAGVVIGGNAQQVIHAPYYLTSPPIDVSAAVGSVYVEFWRWLNSDYANYMINSVDVWNGAQWINVWVTGGSPGVQDEMWTKVSFDLTNYKNAALQVRFGFQINQSGVFNVSSWNVDDFVIANQVCN